MGFRVRVARRRQSRHRSRREDPMITSRLGAGLLALVMVATVLSLDASSQPPAPQPYVPTPVFCAAGGTALCSTLPAYIGPDPALGAKRFGYPGIFSKATSPADDSQSPFDNMAWQMFVALNWLAGAQQQPPAQGLTATGTRVWQTWPRVEAVFGNGAGMPGCPNPKGLPSLVVASNGQGAPSPRNQEYLQASTGLP